MRSAMAIPVHSSGLLSVPGRRHASQNATRSRPTLLQDRAGMSSLLYLGAGLGVTLLRFGWHVSGQAQKEARLNVREWPWLTASVLVGGVLAPMVLMFS